MTYWKSIDVKRTCENKLDISFREGKEFNGWFYYNGKKILRVTIPSGRSELTIGTQHSIIKQLRLLKNEFDELNKCPFQKRDFIAKLKRIGAIT